MDYENENECLNTEAKELALQLNNKELQVNLMQTRLKELNNLLLDLALNKSDEELVQDKV